MGSIKAITAARLAFRGDGEQRVPGQGDQDHADTGADMKDKYKGRPAVVWP